MKTFIDNRIVTITKFTKQNNYICGIARGRDVRNYPIDVGTTSPSFTYGDDKGNQTTILQSQTLRILKISRYVLVPKI